MISGQPNSSRKVGGVARTMTRLMAAALVAVALPSFATIAAAAPSGGAFALKNAAPSNIETVRSVGFWGGGWGRGWDVGAGLATGAEIGGLIAAPYWYGGYYPGYRPYYGYYSAPDYSGYYTEPVDGGYYGGGYATPLLATATTTAAAVVSSTACNATAPTIRATGTFIGNDGRPHLCP